MSLIDHDDRELPRAEMDALVSELRVATKKLSRDQILDLADLLHDIIRERQLESRSCRRVQARTQAQH